MNVNARTAAIIAAPAALAAANVAARRVGRTWGATDAEAAQPLPGDDLVPDIDSQVTMGIDIEAPPEAVWPWLVQMGVDRGGLYTHTWVENGLFRLRVRNADEIVPEWQDLKVGDHIWFTPEDYPTPQFWPRVAAIEPNRHLVCTLGDDPAQIIGTWQFILQPQGPEMTRLLFRSRSSATRPLGTKLFDVFAEPGYLYMEVGMLHGIMVCAERTARDAEAIQATRADTSAPTALVAVASALGATRQIAKAIAAELRAQGIAADVRDAGEVTDLHAYDAVILGSAIHTHRWLPGAEQLVERHRASLATKPVWLFSSGMLTLDTGTPWQDDYPRGIDQLMQASGARAHRIFTGRRVMGEPKAFWRLFASAFTVIARAFITEDPFTLTEGDYRDWDAMRDWAREIGTDLRAEIHHAAA